MRCTEETLLLWWGRMFHTNRRSALWLTAQSVTIVSGLARSAYENLRVCQNRVLTGFYVKNVMVFSYMKSVVLLYVPPSGCVSLLVSSQPNAGLMAIPQKCNN